MATNYGRAVFTENGKSLLTEYRKITIFTEIFMALAHISVPLLALFT